MAALPLRHLLAQALLGDQEGIESVLLADIFSSGGSRNLYLDKFGRALQILGYLQQNAAPVTTNTGAAATRVRGLYHYANTAMGVTTRQEIGIFDDANAHWEFRTSVDLGITWTFVADLGAGSINRIPDFAQSGTLMFLCNGVVAPQQWDGAALTTAGSTQLAAPAYSKTGAGTLSGNVAWRVLPMVGNVRKLSSVQSLNYVLDAEAGNVTWVADPDVTVTGYEVYRTTATGALFFVEGTVVGRTTVTFAAGAAADTDALLIAGRVLQEFGDPPPVGAYFCEMHQQRMHYFRTDTWPRRGYFSDPGLPYSVYSALNFVDYSDAEAMSDVSTGATGNYQNMLVVWLERSVWTLSGTGDVIGNVRDYTRRRTDAQIGTVSHRTVARIPAGSKYTDSEGNTHTTSSVMLAYWTPLNDIRLFDGNGDTIISFPKQITCGNANYAQRAKFWCLHDRPRQEVTWVFANGADNECSTAVTWNYRHGTWDSRDWPFCHGTEVESAGAASILLAGEPSLAIGGLVYRLWNGFTANGNAINSQWMSKVLYGMGGYNDAEGMYGKPLMSFRKRWRWADLLIAVAGGQASITVEWVTGDDVTTDDAAAVGSRTVSVPTSVIETADGSVIETSDGSELLAQTTPVLLRARLISAASQKFVTSRGLRLRVKVSTTAAQWGLSATDIAYQLLPGEKRSIGVIP